MLPLILLAIAAGATVAKMGAEAAVASQQRQALDLQAKQLQLQTQQKTLGNLTAMEKVLDSQAVALTTRGVAFTSPSYNAIQRATLNIGAKNQKNLDIESSLNQANIDMEKANVNNTLYAQLFGDTANLAFTAAGVASKLPVKETAAAAPKKLPQLESF